MDLETSADVDGIEVPPTIVPPVVSSKDPGPTPSKPDVKGGSSTSASGRPEDSIPDQTRQTYEARGQGSTGADYAAEQHKFLNWLKAQGLSFATMPEGSADKFAVETYPNPVTRNKAFTALGTMFTTAAAMGIKFAPQAFTRPTRKKKEPAPVVPGSVIPPPSQMTPMPGMPQPPATVYPSMGISAEQVQPVVPPPAPKPAPQPPRASAFPSLGQRMKVSILANGAQFGIPPGTEMPIGIYQKDQIEHYGTVENFVMSLLRPIYGPWRGHPPQVYRFHQLDTAAKPLPGQAYDVSVAADPNLEAPPGAAGAMPTPRGYVDTGNHSLSPLPPTAPRSAGTVADFGSQLMQTMLDRALQQAEREQREYEERKRELQDQAKKGEISSIQMMMLMRDLQPPKAVDVAALRRELREELERDRVANAPAPVATSPLPAGSLAGLGLDAPPRNDPVIEKLMEQNAELQRQMMELAQRKPEQVPQKDPMGEFEKLLALAKAIAPPPPPPNPIMEQLALVTMKQLTEPPKAKTLGDFLLELEQMKKASALISGNTEGSGGPSLGETIIEVIGAVSENADKIGAMLAGLRGGAIKSAIKSSNQQRRQLPPNAQQQGTKPITEQRYTAEPETAKLFGDMLKAIDAGISDEDLAEQVMAVLERLRKEADPRGPLITEKVLEKFNAAQNRAGVQAMVLRFFEWIGAMHPKLATEARVNRLVSLFHTNYSAIYGLVNNGAEKVLDDAAPPAPEAPAEEKAPETVEEKAPESAEEPEAGNDEESDEEDDDEEGEEGEENEPETVDAVPAPQSVAAAKVG